MVSGRAAASRACVKAFGPRLVTHVFSGNVAGLPALSLIYALLVKSASLGKVPSEEPLFSSLFARSLAEVSPEIGECLAIVYWKGGNRDLQGVAFDGSDWVIGYGSDATIQDLATQVRLPTRALWYGHKLSFAVVGRERLTADTQDETARRVATDVSFLDQQGCLSPHVIFVESEGPAACVFAEAVAREMESFNRRVPRGVISPAESVAIHRIRATYEFREMENEEVRMFASAQGTDWTVILDPESTFQASCLNRTIRHLSGPRPERDRSAGHADPAVSPDGRLRARSGPDAVTGRAARRAWRRSLLPARLDDLSTGSLASRRPLQSGGPLAMDRRRRGPRQSLKEAACRRLC